MQIPFRLKGVIPENLGFAVALIPLLFTAVHAQNYSTQTVFGRTLVTEGGSATTSLLRYPVSAAVDSAGNIYIVDQDDNRVWKVDTSGKIAAFAGNGTPYYGGDNGPATKAALNDPTSVAVDSSNNVYISDFGNNRVREVTPDGTINTVAGSNLLIFSGDGGPARNAGILPQNIAVDKSGNLYISEGARIREVSAATGIITTIAGNGTPGYSGDNGLAMSARINFVSGMIVDPAGNLYLADYNANVIRRVDAKGVITTMGGTGAFGYSGDNSKATLAQMDPYALALDPAATTLYLTEPLASTVRAINLSSGIISIVGGQAGMFGFGGDGGNVFSATLWGPFGVTVDSSKNILICDTLNQRLRKVSATSQTISTIAGTSSNTFLNHPQGIALDSKSMLDIADTGDNVAKQLNLTTGTVNSLMQYAFLPQGIAEDSPGNIYMSSHDSYLYEYGANGQWSYFAGNGTDANSGDNGKATSASIGIVTSVAVDSSNNVYLADDQFYRIRKVDTNGVITLIAGSGSQGATGDNGKATAAGLDPFDIALDKSGNIYVADRMNNRVRKLTPGGNITTVAGTGMPGISGDNGPATSATLNAPSGVAVDAAGNIYICDSGNHVLRKVTTDGIIHTIAGDGVSYPYNGDGPAPQQNLDPYRVTVDSNGNIYIADWANDRIRKLIPVNATTLAIASGNNQSGPAGTSLSQKLTVLVTGSDGNPFAGASVTFAVASGGAILSPSTPQLTANNGTAAVGVTFGGTPGPVTITASVAGLTTITFTLTATAVQITPASLAIVSGSGQSGTVGLPLPQKLTVKVTGSDGNPYAGASVTFAVSTGNATLNPSAAQQTGSDGTASTSVTLGSTPGTVAVTASVSGLTAVTFSLTAQPILILPQIFAGGVVSGGLSSPAIQVASPNAILSIFGQNFAPPGTNRAVTSSDLVNGMIPTNLAGVCVILGTTRAPIFLVTPGQLNIQAPQVPASGTVTVSMNTNCDTPNAQLSNQVTVNVAAAAPEFFYSSNSGTASNPIAAIDPNGGGIGDPTRLGAGFALAYPGEVIQAFATGLGLTAPAFLPGQLPPTGAQVSGLTVSIDGAPLNASAIQYAGVAPLNAGLDQVNIQLPATLTPGDHTIAMSVNGATSPSGTYISVGAAPAAH